MPLYDYKCHMCGNVQEELVRGDTNQFNFKCKECGNDGGERQLSVPAVIQANGAEGNLFKGGLMTQMDMLNGRPKKSKRVYAGSPSDSTPK